MLVVGNGEVGKTSLIRRFCTGTFTDGYKKTIGACGARPGPPRGRRGRKAGAGTEVGGAAGLTPAGGPAMDSSQGWTSWRNPRTWSR